MASRCASARAYFPGHHGAKMPGLFLAQRTSARECQQADKQDHCPLGERRASHRVLRADDDWQHRHDKAGCRTTCAGGNCIASQCDGSGLRQRPAVQAGTGANGDAGEYSFIALRTCNPLCSIANIAIREIAMQTAIWGAASAPFGLEGAPVLDLQHPSISGRLKSWNAWGWGLAIRRR